LNRARTSCTASAVRPQSPRRRLPVCFIATAPRARIAPRTRPPVPARRIEGIVGGTGTARGEEKGEGEEALHDGAVSARRFRHAARKSDIESSTSMSRHRTARRWAPCGSRSSRPRPRGRVHLTRSEDDGAERAEKPDLAHGVSTSMRRRAHPGSAARASWTVHRRRRSCRSRRNETGRSSPRAHPSGTSPE